MLTQKEVTRLKKIRKALSEYIYRTESILFRFEDEDIEANMRQYPNHWLGWYIDNPSSRQVALYSGKTGAEIRELLMEHLERKRVEKECINTQIKRASTSQAYCRPKCYR